MSPRIDDTSSSPTFSPGPPPSPVERGEPGSPTTPPPSEAAPDPRRWWVLGVLVLSLVVVMTANSSLNLAIPSLVRDTDATSTQLQWIVDAYALVFAGLLLTAGALGDRFGRKGALLVGLAVFGSMSLLATTADEPATLIAIRAVQGLGAALIMPGTLSILAAVFPPDERARAIGIWAGFAASGAAFGIIMSGWLLEHFSWGSVFFINVPITVLAILLVAVLVPTSRDPEGVRLDVVGAGLSIVGLGALLFGIIEGPERGWTDPLTVAGFIVAAVGLSAFLLWEHRSHAPMLDLKFFAKPAFSVGTATIALTFFAMFGMWFLMTQYLQFVRNYTPLEAGVRTLPMVVAMMLTAPRSAGWATRFGRRTMLTTGLLLMTAALVTLASLGTDTPYAVLAFGLVLLGIGMGNVGPPATSAVMTSLPMAKAGVGSAVNDTAREVGGAMGIAVLGSLLASGYRANLDVAGLSAQSQAIANQSVGAAIQEAGRLGDGGLALADAARAAYVDAMNVAFLIAAFVLLATVGVVRRYLPRDRPAAVGESERSDEAGEALSLSAADAS